MTGFRLSLPAAPLRFLLLAGLALATGCLRLEQDIQLRADGSGTLRMAYAVPEETYQALAASDATGPSLPFDTATLQRDFRRYAHLGVHLDQARAREDDGWRHLEISVTFDSLNGLMQTAFFAERSLSVRKVSGDRYALTSVRDPDAAPAMNTLNLGAPGEDMPWAELLGDFHAVLRFEVPGDITDHNGTQTAARKVEWRYDAARDPQALIRFQQAAPRVVFTGSDLTLPEIGRMHIRLPTPASAPPAGDDE